MREIDVSFVLKMVIVCRPVHEPESRLYEQRRPEGTHPGGKVQWVIRCGERRGRVCFTEHKQIVTSSLLEPPGVYVPVAFWSGAFQGEDCCCIPSFSPSVSHTYTHTHTHKRTHICTHPGTHTMRCAHLELTAVRRSIWEHVSAGLDLGRLAHLLRVCRTLRDEESCILYFGWGLGSTRGTDIGLF